jgi:hypothetical protein
VTTTNNPQQPTTTRRQQQPTNHDHNPTTTTRSEGTFGGQSSPIFYTTQSEGTFGGQSGRGDNQRQFRTTTRSEGTFSRNFPPPGPRVHLTSTRSEGTISRNFLRPPTTDNNSTTDNNPATTATHKPRQQPDNHNPVRGYIWGTIQSRGQPMTISDNHPVGGYIFHATFYARFREPMHDPPTPGRARP